jgi:hypothetical protein
MKILLRKDRTSVDTVVDPEQRPGADWLFVQYCPRYHGSAAQAWQWRGMIADYPSTTCEPELGSADLRPTDDENHIRPSVLNRAKRFVAIDVFDALDLRSGSVRASRQIDEVAVPGRLGERERQHELHAPPSIAGQTIECDTTALNSAD